MPRPKSSDQTDAAEKLLASAKKLFLKKGYDRVTIREIADDAGVNSAMIQYYFGDKSGLYKSVLDSIINTIKALMQQAAKNQQSASVQDLLQTYYKVLPYEFVDLAISAMLKSDREIGKYLRENLINPGAKAFEKILAGLQQHGQIRDDVNIEYLRICIQSMMVFPILMRKVLPRSEKSTVVYFEQLARHNIEILMRGAFTGGE
ncbi:MAG: TetR family transcriptional regulator [Gammaproteobacteria bacterium]|nr:TetR family transcriptional regulator [Gammaproteobacteria bacterium]